MTSLTLYKGNVSLPIHRLARTIVSMLVLSDALGRNRILAGLPARERKLIEQGLPVDLIHLGDVIDRAGERVASLCFPVDAAISMMDVKDSAHSLDVALIGAEGCSGASVAQGSDLSPCFNIVEISGWIVRMPVETAPELGQLPYLTAALSRYNLLLMRHVVISVGCSQFHPAYQRTARWLLAHGHRTGLAAFPFTTEFLAAQVGIDQDEARNILQDMHDRRIVKKGHKSIAICDQNLLHEQSCACLNLTREATDTYLDALTTLSKTHAN